MFRSVNDANMMVRRLLAGSAELAQDGPIIVLVFTASCMAVTEFCAHAFSTGNATFEALYVVLRSAVGDHRALGTSHESKIMLMIPDTFQVFQ